MKNVKMFCLLLTTLLLACGEKKEETGLIVLTLNKEAVSDAVKSSEIFKSIRCIPLETVAEALIGEPRKIVIKGSSVYVADRFALYSFDLDGKFKGVIKKDGQGPDEYLSLSDFEVNEDGTVWILSRNNSTIYLYNWQGELKSHLKLDANTGAGAISLLSKDRMCLYLGNSMDENNKHQLKVINPYTGELIGSYLDIDANKAKYLNIIPKNNFTSAFDGGGRSYFFQTFNDTVYEISKDWTITPKFNVSIYGKNIPQSFYADEYTDVANFFQTLFQRNYAYGTAMFAESKENYLYSYYFERKKRLSLISKATKAPLADFGTIVEDALLSGYPIDLTEQEGMFASGSELIIPLLPFDVMEYVKSEPAKASQTAATIKYEAEDQNIFLLVLGF